MNKWDIYWAKYVYLHNDVEEIVRRPVIVLGDKRVLPIVMEITKHPPRIDEPNQWDYPIEEWKKAGLKLPSTAKVSEINYVTSPLLDKYKIGHLSDFDIENIKIMLRTIPEETKSPVHKDNEKEIEEMYRRALKEIGKLL